MTKDNSKKVLPKMERDIFGRRLDLSINNKSKTLPNFTISTNAACSAGDMFKIVKTTLAKTLKSKTEIVEPTNNRLFLLLTPDQIIYATNF